MTRLRLAGVAASLVLLTLALAPIQLLLLRRGSPLARRPPHWWHRAAARIIGLRVETRGRPAEGRPLLLVANHQSWADIVALGRVMPLSFIAKAEVRSWPLFGLLARLQRTVFVERERRRRTREQADGIARRLAQGDAMVLFAEGTTSDGNRVLPFKTALFGAAAAALEASGRDAVLVQPVAVAWTGANGLPLGRFGRPLAAWPGDVALLPHLRRFLREGAVEAVVSFGEPVRFERGGDRKHVAALCEREVRRMLGESLGGYAPSGLMKTSLASPPAAPDIGRARPTGRFPAGAFGLRRLARRRAADRARPDTPVRRALAKDA